MRGILVFLLVACGSDNDIKVSGGTNNKVSLVLKAPICDDPVFDTAESKLACLEAITSIEGELKIDNLTQEQIDLLEELE